MISGDGSDESRPAPPEPAVDQPSGVEVVTGVDDDGPVSTALRRVTKGLPGAEDRPAQSEMAAAVGAAIENRRHLVVQAGTGTGKSLGYLVPALVLGTRAVVATATKALQDQLATRDLPVLAELLDPRLRFAVLKGRSNYFCRQRGLELSGAGDQLPIDTTDTDATSGPSGGSFGREIRRLVEWGDAANSGDRADLSWEPSPAAWAQVSVGPRDCPGATRCPSGDRCFAEAARARAREADVVVVNTHLYATHLAAGGELLPAHDLVVFDEAHELEDIASAALGFEVTASRLSSLGRLARPLVTAVTVADAVDEAAILLGDALAVHLGQRLTLPLSTDLDDRLRLTRERVARLQEALRSNRSAPPQTSGPAGTNDDSGRRSRASQACSNLINDLDAIALIGDDRVAWVEGREHACVLKVAPVDIGTTLGRLLWKTESAPTAVLTSATIPPRLAERIGLISGSYDELDVGSPFDYRSQALLYCPVHLPDPRTKEYENAMIDELVGLIDAAGGRTMALFTSWRSMAAAAAAVRTRIPWPVLTQSDLPKPALVARFAAEEQSCLFATMGFWQGVDVPGPALSLVTIDRLPFPRPDDPLLQARRDRLGRAAFATIDVPRAATLLAQGAGRLIRSSADRGVVAVLDPRLGTARYRWDLVRALPPMRRTRHLDAVVEFLLPLHDAPSNPIGTRSNRSSQ